MPVYNPSKTKTIFYNINYCNKITCGFASPATPKTRSGFVFFSFTTHKVYEFHFPQHHDLKICAPPPYPNTILLLFLSATRRLNLKYVSPPAHPQPETVSLGAATQNTYLFCSPQLHDTKYFDPSLSQFSPKICRFCFPQLVDQKSSGLVVLHNTRLQSIQDKKNLLQYQLL